MKDKFNILTILSIITLVILVGVFIFLNSFTRPHLNDVQINGSKEAADFSNQKIRFDFNRPLKKNVAENLVEITPAVKFKSILSGNSLFVIPNETLSSYTHYTVTLDKDKIEDIYGDKPQENITYEFNTKRQQLAYIERQEGQNDKVVLTDVNFSNKTVLYEAPKLKFFKMNANFLVVVTDINKSSEIVIINRRTNEQYNLGFKNIAVDSFDLSPTKNEFAYTKQDIEIMNNYYIPKSQVTVNIYDLEAKTEKQFNPKNSAIDVTEIKYSKDGKSLLYKSADSFFNISETDNEDNIISIGRFLASGNFNFDSSKIIFLTFDPLVPDIQYQFITVFDADRNTTKITDGSTSVLDPVYLNKSDKILFAEKFNELEGTKGMYKINIFDETMNNINIAQDQTNSFELPKPSPDDRYIAIEKYNSEQLLDYKNSRNFGFQNKPYYGSLVIFDSKDSSIIDKQINGVSAVWLTN